MNQQNTGLGGRLREHREWTVALATVALLVLGFLVWRFPTAGSTKVDLARAHNEAEQLVDKAWDLLVSGKEPGLNWLHDCPESDAQVELAVRHARDATEMDPSNDRAWNVLAVINKCRGNRELAIEHMKHALSLVPSKLQHIRNLTLLYIEYDELNAAESQCKEGLSRYPKNAGLQATHGRILMMKGQTDDGLKKVEGACAADPSDPWLYGELGDAYGKKKEWDSAIKQYENGLVLDPENATLWAGLGWALMESGQLKRANDCLDEALARVPHLYRAVYNAGQVRRRMGNCEDAIPFFERAFKLRPKEVLPLIPLSECLVNVGRLFDAKVRISAAHKMAPGDCQVAQNVGAVFQRFARSEPAESEGVLEEAMTMLEVSALQCAGSGLFRTLSSIASQAKQNERAMSYAGYAAYLAPADSDVAVLFAMCLANERLMKAAIGVMESCVQRDPENFQAGMTLSLLYRSDKREGDAQRIRDIVEHRRAVRDARCGQ